MKHFTIWSIAAVVSLLSTVARADILFVDFNFNGREIEAATAGAVARSCPRGAPVSPACEKVVVVPVMSVEDRKAALALRMQVEAAEAHDNPAAEKASTAKLVAFLKNRGIIAADAETVDYATLADHALTQMERDGRRSVTLTLSGHAGGREFDGKAGEMNEKEIATLFAKHPDLARAVTSVDLWGCYSNTPAQARFWQQMQEKVFPNLATVNGWTARSPYQDEPIDTNYLSAAVAAETGPLTREESERLVNSAVQKSGGTRRGMAVANYPGNAYVTNTGANGQAVTQNLAEVLRCDPAAKAAFETDSAGGIETFLKYFAATEPGYQDVPKGTGESNPIRQVYNRGRKLQICYEDTSLDQAPPPADARIQHAIDQEMIALIFFRAVRAHFESAGKPELAAARAILARIGRSALLPANFGAPGLTRAQIVSHEADYERFLGSDTFRGLSPTDQVALQKLRLPLGSLVSLTFAAESLEMVESNSLGALRRGFLFGMNAGDGGPPVGPSDSNGQGPGGAFSGKGGG